MYWNFFTFFEVFGHKVSCFFSLSCCILFFLFGSNNKLYAKEKLIDSLYFGPRAETKENEKKSEHELGGVAMYL